MEETTLLLNKPKIRNSKFSFFKEKRFLEFENVNMISEDEEKTIHQMLNSLLVRIECPEKVRVSECLSNVVYSHVKGSSDWIIHVYLPVEYLGNELCSRIRIILKRNDKVKFILFDMRNSSFLPETDRNHDSERKYIGFTSVISQMYKTGSDSCDVVAVCENFEKKKFKINSFDNEIPSSLRFPSCWNVFFEISKFIQERIEPDGTEERYELAKLLNFWATIVAVQNNGNKKNRDKFLLIDGDFPKSIVSLEELRSSPMFILMFILCNCETNHDFEDFQCLKSLFERVLFDIDSTLQNQVEKQQRSNSLIFLMSRIYGIGMIYIKGASYKKEFLSRELASQFSHLLCLNKNNDSFINSNMLEFFFEIHRKVSTSKGS